VIKLAERININVGSEIHKKLKLLSVEKETSINDLVVEAINDLLNKYSRNDGEK
jgi:hypothetical protein